jgi:hypothetical protein
MSESTSKNELYHIRSLLNDKPDNYKLAYVLAYAAAKGGADLSPNIVFESTLDALNEADRQPR